MSIHLQALRSSSSGNCLAIWTPSSSILIDCGISTQRALRELLEVHGRRSGSLDGVLVSHAHGDHMTGAALKVLQREGIPIYGHRQVLAQVRERHRVDEWDARPSLRPVSLDGFEVGDFRVTPVPLPHAPGYPNFGFVVTVTRGRSRRTIVTCTDFHDFTPVLPCLVDADAVFVEANHDLELLRRYPNPNSRYHLNNVKAAWLLYHAVTRSRRPARHVLLGHLSEERNRNRLALAEVRGVFERQGVPMPFQLDAAPAHDVSPVVDID